MRNVKEFIVEQLRNDDELRLIHLQSAISSLLGGEKRSALLMLRDIVNATCGFPKMASSIGLVDKSMQRMLSANGNPNTDNLMKIIKFLIDQEHVETIELRKSA